VKNKCSKAEKEQGFGAGFDSGCEFPPMKKDSPMRCLRVSEYSEWTRAAGTGAAASSALHCVRGGRLRQAHIELFLGGSSTHTLRLAGPQTHRRRFRALTETGTHVAASVAQSMRESLTRNGVLAANNDASDWCD